MVWQQWRAVQVEARRTGARAVGVDPLRRARLGAPDPARGRPQQRGPTASTISASRGRCRSPKRACRPSWPPTRTTPTMRPTPSCPGAITDAQARYNLTNLLKTDGTLDPVECAVAAATLRDCRRLGRRRRRRDREAGCATCAEAAGAAAAATDRAADRRSAARAQLAWLGIDAEALQRARALHRRAARHAATSGQRQHRAARSARRGDHGPRPRPPPSGLSRRASASLRHRRRTSAPRCRPIPSCGTGHAVRRAPSFFEVRGRLRLGDAVLEQRSLVQAAAAIDVVVLQRERVSSATSLRS